MDDEPFLDFAPFRHDVSDVKSLPKECGRPSFSTLRSETKARRGSSWLDAPDGYENALAEISATLIAKCDDALKIVFVGRSPEGFYEYLRACYKGTEWEKRFEMFMFSYRMPGMESAEDWMSLATESRFKLRPAMRAVGLAPEDIIRRKRPTALVDFVYAGTTMNCLFWMLAEWCVGEKLDLAAMLGKLRVISIERKEKLEYSWEHRGYDHLSENEWIKELGTSRVKRIWVSEELWCFASDWSPKICLSYTHDKWGTEREVERDHEIIPGVQLCIAHYDYGMSKEGKAALRHQIAKQSEMRWPWLRDWLAALRPIGQNGAQKLGSGASQSRGRSARVSKSRPFKEFDEFDDKWLQNTIKQLDKEDISRARKMKRRSKLEVKKDISDQVKELKLL